MKEPRTPKAWANFFARLWGERFPVDVRAITLEYSAQRYPDPITKIREADVDAFEGALVSRPAKGCWYILYNPNIDGPGRINFTIGHEFGHYLLHRTRVPSLECSQRDLIDYGGPESQKREHQANEFAAYLLMPIDDFRRQVGGLPITLDILGHCADRYNVSLTAATLKWLEFTQQRAVLVIARDDFILWSRASKPALKSGVFYRSGTPLPEGSVAKTGLPHGDMRVAKDGVALSPGVWKTDEPTTEMAIFSDRYDMTISLVLLPEQLSQSFEEETEELTRIEEAELQKSWTPTFHR